MRLAGTNVEARRRMRARFFLSGFTLVDLIITLLLLVTLAGISSFYYQEFRDTQKLSIGSNELDTYVKAVQAYELTTSAAIDDALVTRYTSKGFPPLQFLVDRGVVQRVEPDPWGRNYQIDTAKGIVYSIGPKNIDEDPEGADDIRKPYKKELATGGNILSLTVPRHSPCDDDKEAPVVSAVEPIGTVDRADPPVRFTFFDNVGGSVLVQDKDKPGGGKPKLFIDSLDVDQMTGKVSVSRSSNQMVFTSEAGFSENQHIAIAQVEDGCGNISRRQWKFTVDVSPLNVAFKQPDRQQVRGTIDISAVIYNQGHAIDRWTLLFDSRTLVSDVTYSSSLSDAITLYQHFDTVAQGVPDGTHVLTLSVAKKTGHAEETRLQINVDNTPPIIQSILNKTSAGSSCLQAQRITTTTPDIGGVARDNFTITNVKFQYFSVDQSSGATVAALTQPTTAIPPDWSPDTNTAHLSNNPGALFNSGQETFYTRPHGSASQYKPTTLPEGLYQVRFQATDLAGNVSALNSKATTCFYIDLQQGGVKNVKFVDQTSPRCNQAFSEDQRHIRGSRAASSVGLSNETSGHVEFTILDAGTAPCPICTWEVIVDDNGPGGKPDGKYSASAPYKDWATSTSYQGQPGGQLYRTPFYEPDAPAESLRRSPLGTSPAASEEGARVARVRYVSPSGTTYTTYSTFYIDNSPPLGSALNAFVVRQTGTVVPLKENDILFNGSDGTNPSRSLLEFGGIFSDLPANGVIREARWSLAKGPLNNQKPIVNNTSVFPYAGSPCTTHTASFGVAAGLGPQAAAAMTTSTTNVGGLDGEYRLTFSVTDGAGLTSAPIRHFYVDTLPPEVQSIRVFKPGGPAEGILANITCAQGSSVVTTIDGPALRFTPIVQDQFPVREVHYWLLPITSPPTVKSAPIVISITGVTPFPNIPEQVVRRDTRNAGLKPLPLVYELQVEAVGVNRPVPGPLCRTSFSFKFLSNLALFAPLDGNSSRVAALDGATLSTARTWISSQEQADASTYLLKAFPAASQQLFDFSGRNGRSGIGDATLRVGDWLSQNATNGSTDILVLFDSVPAEAVTATAGSTPPLKAFLEGGSGLAHPDGNVVVYVGPQPFVKAVRQGSSSEAPVVVSGGVSQATIFGTDLGIDLGTTNGLQQHNPLGQPLPFVPSLYEYQPFSGFVGSGPGNTPDNWLRCGPHILGTGAGDWVLEQLYTVEQGGTRGNNFVYRNVKSQGIFASFYAIGKSSLAEDRFPITPMPYVIEEFLKNYVTGDRNPALSVKRILFNNADTGFPAALVRPAGTSTPRDVYAYPSGSGAYSNLTTNGGGGTDAQLVDVSDDGRSVTLLARDRSKEGGSGFNAPAISLFGQDASVMRKLALAKDAGGPVVAAGRARRGGTALLGTKSDLAGVNGGNDLSRVALFRIDGSSGNATQLTSGSAVFGDAADPYVSPEGDAETFVAPNVYDATDGAVPTDAFKRLKTLASGGIGVHRYSSNATGAEVYRDGWVTRSLGEAPICGHPRITSGGSIVAFQARNVTYHAVLTATDQVYLAIAQTGSTPTWSIGAITQAGAFNSGNIDMAESGAGGGTFPPIVFESSGDFRGQKANNLPISIISTSAGAAAVGDLGFKAIWLFTGDFSAELIPVARGADADCRNPRISPDASEVVFESTATEVIGAVSVGAGGAASEFTHSVKNASAKNRVYRARIRIATSLGGSPSTIVERITPEGVDIGTAGLPAIAR